MMIHDELLLLCLAMSANEYVFTLVSLDSVMFTLISAKEYVEWKY